MGRFTEGDARLANNHVGDIVTEERFVGDSITSWREAKHGGYAIWRSSIHIPINRIAITRVWVTGEVWIRIRDSHIIDYGRGKLVNIMWCNGQANIGLVGHVKRCSAHFIPRSTIIRMITRKRIIHAD